MNEKEKEIAFEQSKKLADEILNKAFSSKRVALLLGTEGLYSHSVVEGWEIGDKYGSYNQISSSFYLCPRLSKPNEMQFRFNGGFLSSLGNVEWRKKLLDEIFDAVYSEVEAACKKEGVKIL